MAVNGKPGIATPRGGDRGVSNAIDAIRARLEAIEAELNRTALIAGKNSQDGRLITASISNLQTQISNLSNEIDEFTDLLTQADGLVVLADGELITRELEAGTNVTIENTDGVDGNPVISAAGVYPFLTTELDDDILTEDGHRIRIED